jgi:hypothetical protein
MSELPPEPPEPPWLFPLPLLPEGLIDVLLPETALHLLEPHLNILFPEDRHGDLPLVACGSGGVISSACCVGQLQPHLLHGAVNPLQLLLLDYVEVVLVFRGNSQLGGLSPLLSCGCGSGLRRSHVAWIGELVQQKQTIIATTSKSWKDWSNGCGGEAWKSNNQRRLFPTNNCMVIRYRYI